MPGRRVGLGVPVLVALLLGPALSVAPPLAQGVAAADTLREVASATYVADPEQRVIHVTVTESATNLKPDVVSGGITRQFFYNELLLPIHSEATGVVVSDSRGSLRVTRAKEDGYDLLTIRLRSSLYYRQTVTLTLRYDLPGGAPRSESQIRVGQAFVGLYLYAWGDPGEGSLRLELPAGFEPEINGDDLTETADAGKVILSSTGIAQPYEFFAVISANRDARLASTRIALGDGDTILIRAWPEDDEWQARVADTLRNGTPLLRTLIGLDWPVDGELVVTEVQSAALEGYAGIYDSLNDTILITEELDELTIVHEASHAWFNDELFDARWITEGLADGYASLVLDRLQSGEYEPPERPRPDTPGAGPLNGWRFPGRIVDDETADREDYGYSASWWIVRSLIDEVGDDGMRAVLRAAENDEIAYLGDGPPEEVLSRDGWRRFLDLLEERASATSAEEAFREFVLTDAQLADLAERATAREAYAELVDAGDELAPPFVVRDAMSDWRFEDAARWIAEAEVILEDRVALEADAAALGVTLPDDVDDAWRAPEEDLDAVHGAVYALDGALDDLAATRRALDAERDFVVTVGLLGATPENGWDSAVAAFEASDLEAADTATDEVDAVLARAPDDGRARLAGGGALLGGVVLGGVLLLRRRQRRRGEPPPPAEAATPGVVTPTAVVAVAPTEASATLPAQPGGAAADEPHDERDDEPHDEPHDEPNDERAEPRLDPAGEA